MLLAGDDADAWRARVPADVLAVAYASHAALFPRAAAIVHQGGIGTTAEAMRAGKPQVVMPFAHDQFDNARRVEQLSIGRQISRRTYSADRVARELASLLGSASHLERAEIVGQSVRSEDGIASACDNLEAMLARSQPLGLGESRAGTVP